MPILVDRIADLIGLRDRDELDVALVRLTWELLGTGARAAAILRPVGEDSDARWLTRIRFTEDQVAPSISATSTVLEDLPKMAAYPEHQATMVSGQVRRYHGSKSLTLFPLSAEHEGLGVFEVETELTLPIETERLLTSLLRIYHNFQSLLDYGERDTLTNLLNRKTFDGVFLKSTLGARAPEPATMDDRRHVGKLPSHWLGIIDIDHFKRVNDTYGHLIGDEVLILMARLMRSSFRFHDHIYRFGGEEFAVMVQCDLEGDARAAFERFRLNAQAHAFPQVGNITVSIGLTALRRHDTPSEAFERADKALYHAKGNGRNQVCDHADLVTTGEVVESDMNNTEAEFF
jgi:diguanylate cyclase (GGDEF)-like protein